MIDTYKYYQCPYQYHSNQTLHLSNSSSITSDTPSSLDAVR